MEDQIDTENRYEGRSPSRGHDDRRSPSRGHDDRRSASPVRDDRPRDSSRERRHFEDRRGYSRDRRAPSRERRTEVPRSEGNSSSLIIRNITEHTTVDDIRAVFERFGAIKDIYIPRNFYSKRPRNFAFVEFDANSNMDQIQKDSDNTEVNGNRVSVEIARNRRKASHEMRPRNRPFRPRGGSRDRFFHPRPSSRDRRGGSRDRGYFRGPSRDRGYQRDMGRNRSRSRSRERRE